MFEDYMSELNSEMTPEQADSLDERYRTGLEAIQDDEWGTDLEEQIWHSEQLENIEVDKE